MLAFQPLLVLLPVFFLSFEHGLGMLVGGGAWIAVMWFLLCQNVKRLYDLGRSGWFFLLPIFVLSMLFQKGVEGNNCYGSDPKAEDAEGYRAPFFPVGLKILGVGLLSGLVISQWVGSSQDILAADQVRVEAGVFAFVYTAVSVLWFWWARPSASEVEDDSE
jgi:hypothetical protein